MKPAPLQLLLPLLLPFSVNAAGPLAKPELREDGQYTLRDRGQPTRYRIAMDELQQSGIAGDKRIRVSARDRLRKIQETAKAMSGADRKLDLVAYEVGRPQTEQYRRTVTARVALTLQEGIDPLVVAKAAGALSLQEMVHSPRNFVFEFPDATEALTAAEALESVPGVLEPRVLLGAVATPASIPNDPLFLGNGAHYGNDIYSDRSEIKVTTEPILIWSRAPVTNAHQWYLSGSFNAANVDVPPVFYNPLDAPVPDNLLPPFVTPNTLQIYPRYYEILADINVEPAWDLLDYSRVDFNGNFTTIDGTGVSIGLVDTGVDLSHPDLNSLNLLRADDYNFIDGAAKVEDPTPPYGGGFRHGTAVAGIMVGQRNNSRGISGIAPNAKLAAYRLLGGFIDDATFSDALAWKAPRIIPTTTTDYPPGNEWRRQEVKFDISVNPWYYNTNGSDLQPMDPWLRKAMAYGVTEGRKVDGIARGVVYVFPAGNDGETHGNVDYVGTTNSIYSLTVGAVTDLGRRILYSSPGAALHAVGLSGGSEMAPRIADLKSGALIPELNPTPPTQNYRRAMGWTLTPDQWDHPDAIPRLSQPIVTLDNSENATSQAGYYNNFNGTSPAAGMAGGVVALMLQANPRLGWRDVQEIIMRSARVVDPMMGEWSYNHNGVPMSHSYGAGLIDAFHAVSMARVWKNLGARNGPVGNLIGTTDYREVKGDLHFIASNRPIPDNSNVFTLPNATKQVLTLSVPPPASGLRLEHVVVRLKVIHERRGDLGVILTSPKSGQSDGSVESYLLIPHREDQEKHIGLPFDPLTNEPISDNGTDRDLLEGEYWDFTTVRHWGTNYQNQLLDGNTGGDSEWTLTIWDNTQTGRTPGNPRAENPEERVPVFVDNKVGQLKYAAIIYHGTMDPSLNEPPTVTNNSLQGATGASFTSRIRTITDLTPDPVTFEPRAPVYSYGLRVIGKVTETAPDLLIAPATLEEYALWPPASQPTNDEFSPAYLRFDPDTGLLTNLPYPGSSPNVGDPNYVPPFRPLPKETWLVELRATSVFGTTRKQIQFRVDDPKTYVQWKNEKFTAAERADPAISGDNADPDYDGVGNLLEYAMGGEPKLKEPDLLPVPVQNGASLFYDYQVNTAAIDATPIAQVSPNLDPIDSWLDLIPDVIDAEGTLQTRQVRVLFPDPAFPRLFLRLRAALAVPPGG